MRSIILIVAMLFLSVGCTQNNSESQQTQDKQEPIGLEQTSFQDEYSLTNEQIASHLATIASEVPDVNDAAAIVAGPYAVVGIDIDEMTERERVGTIKYSVNEALQHDPYGRTAVVIADGDIMTRIREMGNQLREGQPVKGVVDELASIVSRYMPTFPVEDNIKNQNKPNPEDESTIPENKKEDNLRK